MAVTRLRISVIGCGWLGLPLAVELVKRNYKVKGSTTQIEKLDLLQKASIEAYHLKLSDKLYIDDPSLFDSDLIIINIPPGRGDESIISTYRQKVRLLIDEFKTKEIVRIIFISSTGVYQNTLSTVDETLSCQPDKPSGKAVLAGEQVIQDSGLHHTILRMSGLVGGSRQPGNWFKGKHDLPGGDTPVNMVHQKDCIRSIIQVIESSKHEDNIYNICADNHPVKKDFYHQQSVNIEVDPPSFLRGVLPHKIVSNQKFKTNYDFSYRYPDPILFT